MFKKMLNDCCKYAVAIEIKGNPFPSEPLIMSLLLSQHKLIMWLTSKSSKQNHQMVSDTTILQKLV